jgi:hypothetical protein
MELAFRVESVVEHIVATAPVALLIKPYYLGTGAQSSSLARVYDR